METDFTIYKRYRIPRPALRLIAVQTQINFDTLYKVLNGTLPMSEDIANKIHQYSQSSIPLQYLLHGDIDIINDYLYNRVYYKRNPAVEDLI